MRSRIASRLLPILTSLLIVAACAEISLRSFAPWWSDGWKMWRIDPVYARGLQANVRDATVHAHSGEFAFRFSTNAQGFRMDRDVPARASAGQQRILFVGDSFTFGYGVDQGKNFVALFDAEASAQGLQLDVVNAGFASGYTLDTEFLFTREMASRLNPDRVIVGLCISNDLQDLASTRWRVGGETLVGLDKHNDWVPSWIKRSALVNWLVKGVVPSLRERRSRSQPRDRVESCSAEVVAAPRRDWNSDLAAKPEAPSASLIAEEKVAWLLEAWAHEAASAGYELTLLLIPDGHEVEATIHPSSIRAWARVRDVFADAAKRTGVGVLDPVAAMRAARCPDGEDFYFPRDGHWNEVGHRFIGQWLLDQIRTKAHAEITNRQKQEHL